MLRYFFIINNPLLNNKELIAENQTNQFSPMKDIEKLLSFVLIENLNEEQKRDLYFIFLKNNNSITENNINSFKIILRRLWYKIYNIDIDIDSESINFPSPSNNFQITNTYICNKKFFNEKGDFINFLKMIE